MTPADNTIKRNTCDYCDKDAYKSDGLSKSICINRAYTGDCNKRIPRSIGGVNLVEKRLDNRITPPKKKRIKRKKQ